MKSKKILYICGSRNQTTMLHQISQKMPEHEHFFSAYYSDGVERFFANFGVLDFTVLGGRFRLQTEEYLKDNNLYIDYEGRKNNYDLVVNCSDLIIPKNIRDKKIILVQEGMTDPENIFYHMSKKFGIPRYYGGTASTGLSDSYKYFCVASEGYREHFIRKGVKPEKIIVTGIPNFDNCEKYLINDFPYKNYLLACSSDMRETHKYENRKKFIQKAVKLSGGRLIIFKLHPNEYVPRAAREINKWAPGSLIFSTGNTNEMIANCDILLTKFSTVVYVGLALGKEVYSEFDLEELKRLMPLQNGNKSAERIAGICQSVMEENYDLLKNMSAEKVFSVIKESYVR
ncbi:MAG TPA: hypothetical protein PK536_11490 [Ignavibacteria bacterium]|nr:hypothetical protein [Ignavibacteria bacterium]HRJ99250.1 hypothetical protein [Ignavibacteria bacterium]